MPNFLQSHKKIVEDYTEYIKLLNQITSLYLLMSKPIRTILLLGSGLMAESIVTYLLSNPRNRIHVASNILAQAKKLAQKKGLDRCTYSEVNVQDKQSLRPLIYTSDIVISYTPAVYHIHVAEACLEVGRNLVTASYISEPMQGLDAEVKKKGLVFLNELGLDPGIDHLSTMKVVDEIHQKGGKLVSYESWCGGLPSPSSCDNPLGYKFTWSPIGAFRALKNKAVFIDDGKQVQVSPEDLLYTSTNVKINNALILEGYPNRDSVSYKDVYRLHDAKKVLRGTLRYYGFCELINAFKQIGYFHEGPVNGENWLEYTTNLLSKEAGQSLVNKIVNRTVYNVKHYKGKTQLQKEKLALLIIQNLQYFGFTLPTKFADKKLSSLENLVRLVEPKLSMKPGDTDLIAMQHRFVIELNGKRFLRKSTLVEMGSKNGYSAMSLTVGIPSAIGAELILDGKISERGVIRPIYKDIYEPTLLLLEKAGIKLVEEQIQF